MKQTESATNHIFGPVPSRRLGRSLGVDVVPFKTCSYDCIYCQLGRTTCKTMERKEWVPLSEIVHELKDKLNGQADTITISGSGEPTLYAPIGELIATIKGMTSIPVTVLTNGSMLWSKEVRRQLLHADLVIPSLDAATPALFQAVNRPHEDLSFEKMVQGLIDFRKEFTGKYWLEVMLLGGQTGIDAEVKKLAELAARIQPDIIQLNTVVRPPAEYFADAVPPERMMQFAQMFPQPAQVIPEFSTEHFAGQMSPEATAREEDVLNLLRRRPCSLDQVAQGLNMHRNEVVKYLEALTFDMPLNRLRTKIRFFILPSVTDFG
jgi:wyosine [tRNA(Phe)-imidazoG37] synthetase (radical SAM superfamily)